MILLYSFDGLVLGVDLVVFLLLYTESRYTGLSIFRTS